MSRIGKKVIIIPEGVEVSLNGRHIDVKGSKGELHFAHHSNVEVIKNDNSLVVNRRNNDKLSRALHGLTRNLIANMIEGVTNGFVKQLELKGVGFRAQTDEKSLTLNVGYTHPVVISTPDGIEFKVDKNTLITVSGIDKQKVGQVAANIRAVRQPEPYKGKGIRYVGELVRRKAGKATKASG